MRRFVRLVCAALALFIAVASGAQAEQAGGFFEIGTTCDLVSAAVRPDTAIKLCTKVIGSGASSADRAWAFFVRGHSYADKGDKNRAVADYSRAIELDPNHAYAFGERGSIYGDRGEYDRAISDLTRAIELDPGQSASYQSRGVAYLKTRKLDLARADLQKALELRPDYTEAKTALAELEKVEASAGAATNAPASPPAPAAPTTAAPPPVQTSAPVVAAVQAPAPAPKAAPSVAPAPLGKRVALVIGNSDYQKIGKLDNPTNDAKLIAGALQDAGFTLVGGGPRLDLDKAGFDAAVQEFGNKLQGADVALFYYAGHGVQVRGSNFLAPINANPTKEADVDFQLVNADVVLRQMESAGTKLNLVMLDACRNNPLSGRGLRASGGGLAVMQAPEGTLISFATQPGALAQDGSDGNSPYTKALAEVIRIPGLDILHSFNEVGLRVKKVTGGAQQPWQSSSPIEGEFYFKPGS